MLITAIIRPVYIDVFFNDMNLTIEICNCLVPDVSVDIKVLFFVGFLISTLRPGSVLFLSYLSSLLFAVPSIHVGMVGTREKSDKIAEFLVRLGIF